MEHEVRCTSLNGLPVTQTSSYVSSGAYWHSLPPWITMWIRQSASIFLTLCIGCFSAGLVLFTFASNQVSDHPSQQLSSHSLGCMKKTYTSVLTLVFTAVISFGLVAVSVWIAHERWISPIMSGWLLLPGKLEDWRLGLPGQAMPIRSHGSRDGSFSNLSDTFTFSDEASTNITARISLLKTVSRIIPSIWGGIRSSIITTDITAQHQSHDPENPLPVQEATSDETGRPSNAFGVMASTATAALAAAKMFRRGIARNVNRMTPMSTRIPARVAETPSIPVSPFRLAFPSQPQRILKYAQPDDISDMEYSPGGFVLAVTR